MFDLRCEDRIASICRVGHDRSDNRSQADGAGLQDVGGGLAEKSSKLGLVRSVEQEMLSGTVIRVRHFDGRLVVVAVQSQAVVNYV